MDVVRRTGPAAVGDDDRLPAGDVGETLDGVGRGLVDRPAAPDEVLLAEPDGESVAEVETAVRPDCLAGVDPPALQAEIMTTIDPTAVIETSLAPRVTGLADWTVETGTESRRQRLFTVTNPFPQNHDHQTEEGKAYYGCGPRTGATTSSPQTRSRAAVSSLA